MTKYWLIECVGADRFETLLKAATWEDAIKEGQDMFNDLSEHDRNRRASVEVWAAPRYTDEDTPDTLIIPDDDAVEEVYPIK